PVAAVVSDLRRATVRHHHALPGARRPPRGPQTRAPQGSPLLRHRLPPGAGVVPGALPAAAYRRPGGPETRVRPAGVRVQPVLPLPPAGRRAAGPRPARGTRDRAGARPGGTRALPPRPRAGPGLRVGTQLRPRAGAGTG